uniref:Uncharacterized protein n=1 Tax=Musa acuminata subsp. malaccensis TaxID=214687 RepID=A0A804JHZ5_MUSAM
MSFGCVGDFPSRIKYCVSIHFKRIAPRPCK